MFPRSVAQCHTAGGRSCSDPPPRPWSLDRWVLADTMAASGVQSTVPGPGGPCPLQSGRLGKESFPTRSEASPVTEIPTWGGEVTRERKAAVAPGVYFPPERRQAGSGAAYTSHWR